jgi:subtilase family serine protease
MGRFGLRTFFFLTAASLAGCGSHGAAGTPVPAAPQTAAVAPALSGVPATTLGEFGVYVHLPLRNSAELESLVQAQSDQNSPQYHHFLSPDQFRERYGASAAQLATVASTLQAQGLRTATTSQGVFAAGPQAAVERTFGVHFRAGTGIARQTESGSPALVADRTPVVPQALSAMGASVVFHTRRMHVDSRKSATAQSVDNRYGPNGPYWFTDLKEAYGYPSYSALNGRSVTIGIVIDSDVSDADTQAYFTHEKLSPVPVVHRRYVNGGSPFDPNSNDSFEASLDVQQSLGSAPGARLLLYDIASLNDDDILAGYQALVDENKADVVSSSFGACELYYLPAWENGVDYTSYLKAYHDIFAQGNAQGITFVASSGDNGAYECLDPTGTSLVKGVSTPATDSAVTAVGGTNLLTNVTPGSLDSAYVSENAFGDTFDNSQSGRPVDDVWGSGGGISQLVAKPWYQYLVNTGARTRTVPDIAMQMGGCPQLPCDEANRSSAAAAFGGYFYGAIGTSASSPEFAGLLAVTEERLRTRLGNANGYIYLLAATGGDAIFRHAIPGNNGNATHPGYPSGGRYNYVVGNGTPRAAAFALDPRAPLAGTPQTPSNP